MLYRISLPFWVLTFWVEDFKYQPLRPTSVPARSSQTRGHICCSLQATGGGCSPWRGLRKATEGTVFGVVFHTAHRTSAEIACRIYQKIQVRGGWGKLLQCWTSLRVTALPSHSALDEPNCKSCIKSTQKIPASVLAWFQARWMRP